MTDGTREFLGRIRGKQRRRQRSDGPARGLCTDS
jgi:hypothetical protein